MNEFHKLLFLLLLKLLIFLLDPVNEIKYIDFLNI